MEMMKRTVLLLVLLFVTALLTPIARATFVQFNGYNDTFVFSDMGINADVKCVVYQDDVTDEFKYTYEITNNADVSLSFFSVGIMDGVTINDYGFDTGPLDPEYWGPAGSPPVESFNAEFDIITNGNTASVLWFTTFSGPTTETSGALIGFDGGFPKFASGDVYIPLPEPATVAMLSFGSGLAALIRKKKIPLH